MVEAEVKKTSGEESLQPALDKDAEAADLDRGCASIPLNGLKSIGNSDLPPARARAWDCMKRVTYV